MDDDDHSSRDSDSTVNEISSGLEPGASEDHYLVNIDYDIEDLSDNELNEKPRSHSQTNRKRAGTISKIKKDIKKQQNGANLQGNLAKVMSNHVSSDDTGNSSAASATASESEDAAFPSEGEMQSQMPSGDLLQIDQEKLRHLSISSEDPEHELELLQTQEWKNKKKHVLVLSQSGKPIYSRHGNEEKLVTLFGVMQALVSFIAHSEPKDVLKCIRAGDRQIVFLVKEHLILVAVSSFNETPKQLHLQLHYIYNQIISVLTLSQLNKIYQQRVNYDLRRMLAGTEKFLDNILTVMESDPSYLLGAIKCLPLVSNVRDNISQTILQCCKVKDLVFAIILSDNQLVALVRMKKFSLHPQDLHILLNMVQSSDYFKSAEAWLPICLPNFDNSGFLHAYVSYLDEPCNACLLLLTVDSEQFPILSECKKKIVERLNRHSCLQAIAEAVSAKGYTTQQIGIPEMRHFIYKSRSTAQFISPRVTVPYVTQEQKERLHGIYLSAHGRMHSSERPVTILYEALEHESVLGMLLEGFELYAVFSPIITKASAIACVNKLYKWLRKEESKLFIFTHTTF